jgi:hypothetical protein
MRQMEKKAAELQQSETPLEAGAPRSANLSA